MLLHMQIAAGMLGLFIGHCLPFSSLSVHSLLLMHAALSERAQLAIANAFCKVGLDSCKSLAAVITWLRAFCNSPRVDNAQLKAVTSRVP